MKKLLALVLCSVFALTCLCSCDIFEKKPGYDPSIDCERYENCAVFTFDGFPGGETASFTLNRRVLGEGEIYYQINLEEGALSVKYKDSGLIHSEQPLGEFTADGDMPINGKGGYIEGDRITVTFEASGSVSGEIIIAFTEDALRAIHGNLQLHEHTGEMLISEYTHSYQYTCGCPSNDIAEMHLDGDGDGRCDICEYNMSEHEHTREEHRDANGHGWSYTCGCMTPPNFALHSDGDGDGACDVCGYGMSVDIPSNGLLSNFEAWLSKLDVEDVAEIKTTFEYVGVAPGSLKDIFRTTDKGIIAEMIAKYASVTMTPVSREDTYISGGSAVTIEFILSDGRVKELYFNNGFYAYGLDQDGISALYYFELDSVPTLKEYGNVLRSHGFITYREPGYALRDNDSCEPDYVCDIEVGAFEFVEIEAPAESVRSDLYVDTEFGTLIFIGNSIFYIREYGDKYYRLVGKNLDEMIEEALRPDYTLTMNDPEWLFEELEPTYKAGETVSVKIRKAMDLGYIFLVNGEDIATECDTDGDYWEFTFIMPEGDAKIDFLTYDGFLPDRNYSVLIRAYWMQNLDAEYVYIDEYYGETNCGALVAMIVSGDYDDEVWQEKIGDVTIEYYNGNRITVYYGGEFYTLTEAHEKGYITDEELREIAELRAGS